MERKCLRHLYRAIQALSGYLIFANMRFCQSYFSPIGEYQLAFRQLANIVLTFANWRICYGETKIYRRISTRHSPIGEFTKVKINIYWRISTSFSPIGECTVGETPYWRSYIDSLYDNLKVQDNCIFF